MTAETIIQGMRYVRLRRRSFPIGLGYALGMWVVTNTRDQKQIGPTHFSREFAAKWVTEQGWRYIGSQESITPPSPLGTARSGRDRP